MAAAVLLHANNVAIRIEGEILLRNRLLNRAFGVKDVVELLELLIQG